MTPGAEGLGGILRTLAYSDKGNLVGKSRYYLDQAAKRGFRGYPVATIAFYGPTSDFASKAVVSVFRAEAAEPDALERFFSEDSDVRFDDTIGNQVLALIRLHAVQSVVMVDRIIGCPHEEGVDYPEGSSCPQCGQAAIVGRENAFTSSLAARTTHA